MCVPQPSEHAALDDDTEGKGCSGRRGYVTNFITMHLSFQPGLCSVSSAVKAIYIQPGMFICLQIDVQITVHAPIWNLNMTFFERQ